VEKEIQQDDRDRGDVRTLSGPEGRGIVRDLHRKGSRRAESKLDRKIASPSTQTTKGSSMAPEPASVGVRRQSIREGAEQGNSNQESAETLVLKPPTADCSKVRKKGTEKTSNNLYPKKRKSCTKNLDEKRGRLEENATTLKY